MKQIAYRGGIASFLIPDDWVEEYGKEGGGTFYDDRCGSGTLRLNIMTFQANRPADRIGTDRFLTLFDGRREPGRVVRALDNGNVMCAYAKQVFEQDEELLIRYWEIANRADEDHIRLAIFSFTILASQASDREILAHIAMLDEHLPQTQFFKGLA